ncbi:hypothetical protein [Candidatus Protochlamydia phocaeensis]|uniref:hypothetical protein n=1 Tax=Candidatus Protochlamydia phocaeensis TaxID=1414722 RepID=UPI000838FB79|nr:hypothetical protein [Candidatus Protochlamydia phocaeensis]
MNASFNIHFKFDQYVDHLHAKVVEKPSRSLQDLELKAQEISNRVFPFIQVQYMDDAFQVLITKAIDRIATVKPGRSLLKQLIANNKVIKIDIQKDETKGNICREDVILINPNETSYYLSLNQEGKLKLIKKDLEISLFHEMLHAIHDEKDRQQRRLLDSSMCSTLLPDMDNLEEQVTIAGILPGSSNLVSPCENEFLLACDRPLRLSHLGFQIPSTDRATFIDHLLMIHTARPNEASEFMADHPSFLSEKAVCHLADGDKPRARKKAIFPLTAACYFGKCDLVHQLLDKGAQADVTDDLGGPLSACLIGGEFELMDSLIKEARIPKEEALHALINWVKSEKTPDKLISKLKSFLTIFSAEEKCYLFKHLINHADNFLFLDCLLAGCKGEEKDDEGNTLAMLFITFFIASSVKPLNYGYATLWEKLEKLPSFRQTLEHENQTGESAHSLASHLNNQWLLSRLSKDASPEIEDEEDFDGLIEPFNVNDFFAAYLECPR